jgi:hypothetical protein
MDWEKTTKQTGLDRKTVPGVLQGRADDSSLVREGTAGTPTERVVDYPVQRSSFGFFALCPPGHPSDLSLGMSCDECLLPGCL